jgi:hypothetical protein
VLERVPQPVRLELRESLPEPEGQGEEEALLVPEAHLEAEEEKLVLDVPEPMPLACAESEDSGERVTAAVGLLTRLKVLLGLRLDLKLREELRDVRPDPLTLGEGEVEPVRLELRECLPVPERTDDREALPVQDEHLDEDEEELLLEVPVPMLLSLGESEGIGSREETEEKVPSVLEEPLGLKLKKEL